MMVRWNCFQSCYSLLHIIYWTSMKVYLWVHHQWQSITNMRTNVLLCPFNFTVLPHINLFSPINTDVVCQEKCHYSLYIIIHCCPWPAILIHVTKTFASHFVTKHAVQLNGFTSKQYLWTIPLIVYSLCCSWQNWS